MACSERQRISALDLFEVTFVSRIMTFNHDLYFSSPRTGGTITPRKARPYCRTANGWRERSASRGLLLTALARRTEMSTLLILTAHLNFTRHGPLPPGCAPCGPGQLSERDAGVRFLTLTAAVAAIAAGGRLGGEFVVETFDFARVALAGAGFGGRSGGRFAPGFIAGCRFPEGRDEGAGASVSAARPRRRRERQVHRPPAR